MRSSKRFFNRPGVPDVSSASGGERAPFQEAQVKFDLVSVTGGLGFIGKHFIRRCLEHGVHVRNFDKVSYAADL